MSQQDLESRVRRTFGREPGVRVHDFRIMEDGHAGLTYGFAVADATGERCYVLKVAPRGVRRSGNTDVFRQAPLLRALHRAGLPVPDVPFASDKDDELGSPYIVMERLPGRTFVIWEPDPSFLAAETDLVWSQTAQALASIHAFDRRTHLADWNHHAALDEQIGFWSRILDKADEAGWKRRGAALAAALAASPSETGPIGLTHGDYQPGNVLFEDGRLTGIIDWELACIGPQNLDVGWLLMMADRTCWHEGWSPRINQSRDEILAIYEAAVGRSLTGAGWFQALACFRMVAIASLNVRLHRTGKRFDPLWEKFSLSVDPLLDRGFSLLRVAEKEVV